jgi:hypothetical protein
MSILEDRERHKANKEAAGQGVESMLQIILQHIVATTVGKAIR